MCIGDVHGRFSGLIESLPDAIVVINRLVEAMSGRVGVRSEPGVGSTFYAVLPRTPLAVDGASPAAHRPTG